MKFGSPAVMPSREAQRYGPILYATPVPRIATQSITPRERGGERGGDYRGGCVSVSSTSQSTSRGDRSSVISFQSRTTRKPADKEKKWTLRGWDPENKQDNSSDDGIVAWVKRRTSLEAKRGTKKQSPIIDNEHYFPVESRCPATEDFEQFRQASLHGRFTAKTIVKPEPQKFAGPLIFKFSNNNKPVTVNEEIVADDGKEDPDPDPSQTVIESYRNNKKESEHHLSSLLGFGLGLGRRSKSVPDLYAKSNAEKRNKIKRLLKFSNKDRRFTRFEEDDDEGYSSKTSSAETKMLSGSDGEDCEDMYNKRLSNSMVNLSELPSLGTLDGSIGQGDKKLYFNNNNNSNSTAKDNEPVKFSYTHQPTILQIPHPDMKMEYGQMKVEKTAKSEEVPFSYSRLKRAKEVNKCYKSETSNHIHENTLYDISAIKTSVDEHKPVTLVLRKISIQNAGKESVDMVSASMPSGEPTSRSGSRAGSAVSRSGSAASNTGSGKSRTGSAKSRVKSATSRCNLTPQMEFKNRMQQKNVKNSQHQKSSLQDGMSRPFREPMWSQEYSLIERQATSYCIGDLLPAVDKSIYTHQFVKGKLGTKPHGRRYHGMAPLLTGPSKAVRDEGAQDDSILLLQNGVDMSEVEKPTLGPPPFRPTPARQPIPRSVKVVVTQANPPRSSPIQGKGHYSPIRFSTERTPRPIIQSPEKETQRKLKEAFSKFYQNRPKEIGKEFRRMQTMWNG